MTGKRIRELRKERDISQEELSKALGVSLSLIGMYETESRKPSYEILNKIADYFNVSADYLLGRTDLRNFSDDKIIVGFNDKLALKQIEKRIKEEIVQKVIKALGE
jgi:transcriptional regulator with XRE-family HTH domain